MACLSRVGAVYSLARISHKAGQTQMAAPIFAMIGIENAIRIFTMINRAAVILKYKAPAVAWINQADPYDVDPGMTLDLVNDDRTVYLIKDDDGDGPDALAEWVALNYAVLFESELDGWYEDEKLWPAERDLSLFNAWFDVECHTLILDTVGEKITDDEM